MSPAFQIRKVVVQDKVAKVAIGLAGGFCPGKGWKRREEGNFDAVYRQSLLAQAVPFASGRVG